MSNILKDIVLGKYAVMQKLGETENGELTYGGASVASDESKTAWDEAAAKKHMHGNKTYLDKFSENIDNGAPQYNGQNLVTEGILDEAIEALNPKDTLIPLALDTTYAALQIRADWADVLLWVT